MTFGGRVCRLLSFTFESPFEHTSARRVGLLMAPRFDIGFSGLESCHGHAQCSGGCEATGSQGAQPNVPAPRPETS